MATLLLQFFHSGCEFCGKILVVVLRLNILAVNNKTERFLYDRDNQSPMKTHYLWETLRKAEIWLIQTYWDFEFPHPYLLNFKFVREFHSKPTIPLPKEIEEFVQNSGEDHIVVFSSGYSYPKSHTKKGQPHCCSLCPDSREGHYKTKTFLIHGGINGIYEAIFHGVPIVGVPMFADQHNNVFHMKIKGAAVEVNINTMISADLLSALRRNATWLSRIHRDQPVKSLDQAVFWIEFVMCHKGSKHLQPAAHNHT
ncbi:hypothetical protein GH733_005778 [Mirounga leonina]|nr:hypothetical protein GH733_005778 [Mirounga leonina]